MEQPDKRDLDLRQVDVREDGDLLEVLRVEAPPDPDPLRDALGPGSQGDPPRPGAEAGASAVRGAGSAGGDGHEQLVGPPTGPLAAPGAGPCEVAAPAPVDVHARPAATSAVVAGGALVLLLALLAYLYHLPVVDGEGGAAGSPLGAPSGVRAVPVGAGRISVRWEPVPGAEQYVVQQWRSAAEERAVVDERAGSRGPTGDGDDRVAQSVPTTGTRVVLGVTPSSRVCFTVLALRRSAGTTQLGPAGGRVCATAS